MELQPSAKTSIIPSEIWMHVAQFVPDTDLCSMLSINRVFFQLAMDARYHELTFRTNSYSVIVEAIRRLRRVRDSSIAHRVRALNINLVYGDDLFYPIYNEEGNVLPGTDISTLEGIQIMTETVTHLTNVTELSVQWMHPPGEHVAPFFIVAWKSFGWGLRKLSLDIFLEYLAPLLSTVDGLLVLKDLSVTINKLFPHEAGGDVLATVLAPFVKKVAATLHSLSLYIAGLDVTPLFHNLEKVPNLKRLHILFSIHSETLMEPFGVTRFICNHATTLRHLDWDQDYQISAQQHLMDLLRATNLEDVFLNLHTLRIRVPGISGGFALIAQHIRYSAHTLTSLGLLGYNMTYEEVNTVISIFAPHSGGNLKELSLPVHFLSPELILLLAQTLPHLEKLAIHMEHLTGHEAGKRSSEAIKADSEENRTHEERLHAGIFARTIRAYDIRSWALRDIDIRGRVFDLYLPEKLMRLLAERVPSVQKFCGEDKELYSWLGGTDERL